jgi:hypothetical protein
MKLKSIEEVVMTGEMAECDFCTETKPIARHYLSVKNKHFSDDEKGRYSKYIKYCSDCGIKNERDQHLIQTIRKEVEGMPGVEEVVNAKENVVKQHPQMVMRKDILTYLTKLEEEVSK